MCLRGYWLTIARPKLTRGLQCQASAAIAALHRDRLFMSDSRPLLEYIQRFYIATCCIYDSLKTFLEPFPYTSAAVAPARTKTRNSSSPGNATANFPAPPKMVATKSPARTPIASPGKKTLKITQGQKQALIDNLQLESRNFHQCSHNSD